MQKKTLLLDYEDVDIFVMGPLYVLSNRKDMNGSLAVDIGVKDIDGYTAYIRTEYKTYDGKIKIGVIQGRRYSQFIEKVLVSNKRKKDFKFKIPKNSSLDGVEKILSNVAGLSEKAKDVVVDRSLRGAAGDLSKANLADITVYDLLIGSINAMFKQPVTLEEAIEKLTRTGVYSDSGEKIPFDSSVKNAIESILKDKGLLLEESNQGLTLQYITENMPKELIVSNDLMLSVMRGALYFELTDYYKVDKTKALDIAKGVVRSKIGDERELLAAPKHVSFAFGGTQIRDCYIDGNGRIQYRKDMDWIDTSVAKQATEMTADEYVRVIFEHFQRIEEQTGFNNIEGVNISMPGQPDKTGRIACEDGAVPSIPALYKFALAEALENRIERQYGRRILVNIDNDCDAGTKGEMSALGTAAGKNSCATYLDGSGTNIACVENGKVFTGAGDYEGSLRELGHKIAASKDFTPETGHFTFKGKEWIGDAYPSKLDIDKDYLRLEAAIQGKALGEFARKYGFSIPKQPNTEGYPELTTEAKVGNEKAHEVISLFAITSAKGLAAAIASGDNVDRKWTKNIVLISTVFQKAGEGVKFALEDKVIDKSTVSERAKNVGGKSAYDILIYLEKIKKEAVEQNVTIEGVSFTGQLHLYSLDEAIEFMKSKNEHGSSQSYCMSDYLYEIKLGMKSFEIKVHLMGPDDIRAREIYMESRRMGIVNKDL